MRVPVLPFVLMVVAGPALAAPPPIASPAPSVESQSGSTGLFSNLDRTNFLLGDLFGIRTALSPYGVSLNIQETSEALGNATGGVRQGVDYDGLTQVVLQMDTARAFGLYGGLFNVSALQIHGRDLSSDGLDTLQTASGIEADRATRLWELWFQQKFLDEDRLDIKIGQQSADQEFIVNSNNVYFVNTIFGWPVGPSYDLPGGGPAYPLSAPAIRLRYRPTNALTVLLGVFNGSPASPNGGDSQQVNASGAQFPVDRGPLVIAELQISYPALGGLELPGGSDAPLGHTYKIGVWYDAEDFGDQRFDNEGVSLASPNSTGLPAQHQGDFCVYALFDQMIWRDPGFPNRAVSLFGRVTDTPQPDRNLIDYGANGGIVMHDPIRGRPDDTAGLGFGYAHVSARAAALDRDAAALSAAVTPDLYAPVRGSETFVEATYQYQARPWWQLQPDAQYVFNPGAGAQNQNDPTERVRNELVFGLRTNILF